MHPDLTLRFSRFRGPAGARVDLRARSRPVLRDRLDYRAGERKGAPNQLPAEWYALEMARAGAGKHLLQAPTSLAARRINQKSKPSAAS